MTLTNLTYEQQQMLMDLTRERDRLREGLRLIAKATDDRWTKDAIRQLLDEEHS